MLQDWAKWHATTYQTEACLHCSCAIQEKHLSLLPVQFANDGHFESGRYEYTPAAIAAEDITILVDKPELQKVPTKIAANFNLQYETVRPLGQYACTWQTTTCWPPCLRPMLQVSNLTSSAML